MQPSKSAGLMRFSCRWYGYHNSWADDAAFSFFSFFSVILCSVRFVKRSFVKTQE